MSLLGVSPTPAGVPGPWEGAGGRASPAAHPGWQGCGHGEGTRPAPRRPRAAGGEERAASGFLHLARPAIFQGQRKSFAQGGGHYVKCLGLFQSGMAASSPPEPGDDTALAELLCQPHGTGQGVVRVPPPWSPSAAVSGEGLGPGVGVLICFNVWL